MNPALRTAATGMIAQQIRVEVIAKSLANVITSGFKRSRAHFEDLLYQLVQAPASVSSVSVLAVMSRVWPRPGPSVIPTR